MREFVFPKVKFAMTSAVVTALDYVFYLFLFYFFFSPVVSNVISYSVLMVVNFILQKRFVFTIKGRLSSTFIMSMVFSIIGLLLSTAMIAGLNRFEFWYKHQYLTKVIVTGTIFFYNFYTKRYAFERR